MLRLTRPLGSAARRQLVSRPLAMQVRAYAERSDTMLSSDPSFKPDVPQQGVVKPAVPVTPPMPTPATPASTTSIPPENIPKTPPPPPTTTGTSATSAGRSSSTPPPSSSPPVRKRFRGLRILFYTTLLMALGYGGSVFFALRNDNFHDFFTEYVPFGEDAVLYFEERAFHKRFPNATANVYRSHVHQQTSDKKVKIPERSGLSWRKLDDTTGADVSHKGAHMSAVDDNATKDPTKQQPDDTSTKARSAAVESAKKDASASQAKKETKPDAAVANPVPKAASDPLPAVAAAPSTKGQSSDGRVPVISPVDTISPVTVPNGDETVVQDLVKIVNDMITVVNADGAETANRYAAPLQKAKEAVLAAASKVSALRDAERAAAEERIKEAHREFDKGARDLLERIDVSHREDEIRYREEFESERAKIAEQYEKRLKAEIEGAQQVWEQKLQNELSEQGLKMKQKFIDDIKGLVEAERDGRLSKLTDLSSNVDNLTQLTSNWNGVIDANLATQKLQVAVDAVRSALDDANASHKPTPFVREMAALKLVADNDAVVDAAVASINPAAYQKGIPSTAQLIDRFRRVASEVRKASLLPENAGIASHAASLFLSKVMFKKQGVPEGNDVESILTRTETLLEEGDLDSAAREMNELKGWAGVLSKDWLNDARKVLEVKQAMDVIETEARLQCLRVN